MEIEEVTERLQAPLKPLLDAAQDEDHICVCVIASRAEFVQSIQDGTSAVPLAIRGNMPVEVLDGVLSMYLETRWRQAAMTLSADEKEPN